MIWLFAIGVFADPGSFDFGGKLDGCPIESRLAVDFRSDGKPFAVLVHACPEVADLAAEVRLRCEEDIANGRMYEPGFTVEQCIALERIDRPMYKEMVRGGLRILDPAGREVLSFSVSESEGFDRPEVLRVDGRELLLFGVVGMHDVVPILLGWVHGALRPFDDGGLERAVGLRQDEGLARNRQVRFAAGRFELNAAVYARDDAMCCPSRGELRATLVPVLATGRFKVARASRKRR